MLERYALTDSTPEHEFDHIVRMASMIFDVPIVLVSIVHRDRQFFKARVGLEACETGRDVSFCTFAIMGSEVFVVPDAQEDPRFSTNTLFAGHPNIRFYAGAPLITALGHGLGSLCLIDTKPRYDLSSRDQLILQDLAKMVLKRLELRRIELSDRESRSRFRNIASTSPDGIVCANARNQILSWNSFAKPMFG